MLAIKRSCGWHERLFGRDIVEQLGTAYGPCCQGEELEL